MQTTTLFLKHNREIIIEQDEMYAWVWESENEKPHFKSDQIEQGPFEAREVVSDPITAKPKRIVHQSQYQLPQFFSSNIRDL